MTRSFGIDVKTKRKGRNTGKLSKLLEMPLDVVFEIAGNLLPLDLLRLSRISKEFRQTFASQASRTLWVTARHNLFDLPEPPTHISEPKYASLLFEFYCVQCGVGRSVKIDHALCVRLCGACWKADVRKGSSLLRQYNYPDKAILQLVLREYCTHMSTNATLNSTSSMYYAPEFAAVLVKYASLTASEQPVYIKERQKFVAELLQHAEAVTEWEERVRRARASEGDRAQKSRQLSIETRLFDMGYTTADFPPLWHPPWSALIQQPRALTTRIWKIIEPKLIQVIVSYREAHARAERKLQRRTELMEFYDAWLATQPASLGLVPSCRDLLLVPDIKSLLARDNYLTVFTQDDFDTVVLPQVHKISKENNGELAKMWNAECDKQAKQKESFDMLVALISDFTAFETSDTPKGSNSVDAEEKSQEKSLKRSNGVDNEPEQSSPDAVGKAHADLLRATALFRCGRCDHLTSPSHLRLFSFLELCAHHREHHVRPSRFKAPDFHYTVDAQDVRISGLVLDALKLEDGVLYDQIGAGRKYQVVCACGKPGMKQPMVFSSLIGHLCQEANWMARMQHNRLRENTAHEPRLGDRLIDDHAPGQFPWLLTLLAEGEDYVVPAQPPTTIWFNDEATRACKICTRIRPVEGQIRAEYLHSSESFGHHVRKKHGREPRQEDLRIF